MSNVFDIRTRRRMDGRHLALVTGEPPEDGPTVSEILVAIRRAEQDGDHARAKAMRLALRGRVARKLLEGRPDPGSAA